MFEIVAGQGRSVLVSDGKIAVPGPPERVPARLSGFLKQTARTRLAHASDHYASKLGRSYATLTIRDTRSRWGSCSAAGGLMYSWRLILAPPEVLNYVAAHEVAHLAGNEPFAAVLGCGAIAIRRLRGTARMAAPRRV